VLDEQWYGAADHRLIDELVVIGEVQRQRGDLDRAAATFTRALDLERRHDPASRRIAMWESNLAMVAATAGDFDEAARRGAAALAALEAAFGTDAAELINALVLTGYVARHRRPPDLERSLRDLQRAHDVAGRTLGAAHAETLNTAIELSHTLVALGRATEAVALLGPWLERHDIAGLAAHQPAELRYAAADALAAGGNARRACSLAAEAEAGYRDVGNTPMAAEVADWRKRTCRPG
jgi:tetratricopeptide (TPR) repeat protein